MFVPLFPFPVPIPLIGEQLLPPNRPALPRHGLTAESVILSSPGEKKDRFTHLSQSGKSVWVGGRNPIEGVRLAAGGAKRPPRGVPRGVSPLGDSLMTFSSGRKSPGAPSMARPCSRGAPASGGVGAASFTKSSQGAGRSARIVGAGALVPAKKKGGPAGPQKIFFIRAARKCRPTPARCAPPARG